MSNEILQGKIDSYCKSHKLPPLKFNGFGSSIDGAICWPLVEKIRNILSWNVCHSCKTVKHIADSNLKIAFERLFGTYVSRGEVIAAMILNNYNLKVGPFGVSFYASKKDLDKLVEIGDFIHNNRIIEYHDRSRYYALEE